MDWKKKARREYLQGGTSYRKLAEKYGVSRTLIERLARDEGWVELRRQVNARSVAKTAESIVAAQARRAERMQTLADRLLDRVEQAVEELDIHLVKHVEKVREIEYLNPDAPSRPTREVVREEEQVLEAKSVIDRRGLRELAAAIKDLKEIQMLRSELDQREQKARIASLEAKGAEDSREDGVRVVFEAGMEDYAE